MRLSGIETSLSKLWHRERDVWKNCSCRRRALSQVPWTPNPSWVSPQSSSGRVSRKSRTVKCERHSSGFWAAGASPRTHERVPAFKNTTKIPREDPQRGKKRTKMRVGEGKKREIFGPPPFGAPPFGARPCFFCPVCHFLSCPNVVSFVLFDTFYFVPNAVFFFVPFPVFFFVPWRFFLSQHSIPGFPAELSVWMEDRQKDLQEALSTGDHSRAVTLSLMLTKGAERMVEMTRQDISDDEFRSRAAPGEGRFAPY